MLFLGSLTACVFRSIFLTDLYELFEELEGVMCFGRRILGRDVQTRLSVEIAVGSSSSSTVKDDQLRSGVEVEGAGEKARPPALSSHSYSRRVGT